MSFPPAVKERAMLACERHCCICRETKWTKIECHHIVPEADGGPNTFENCIPVCFDCHAEVGGYNPGHPKGTRYSAGELRQLRDRLYEEIKNRRTLREPLRQGVEPIELASFEAARRLAEDLTDPENRRRSVVRGWELLADAVMKMTGVAPENLDPLSSEVSRALKKVKDSPSVTDELYASIERLQHKAYSAGTMSRWAGYDPDTNAALEVIAECERVREQLSQFIIREVCKGLSRLSAAIAFLLLSASLTLADTDAELSRKILGTWSERTHQVTYLANGKWKLAKTEPDGHKEGTPGVFRWHVKDGNLIVFRDGVTFPPGKIVWVSPDEFFLLDEHGARSASYYRYTGN